MRTRVSFLPLRSFARPREASSRFHNGRRFLRSPGREKTNHGGPLSVDIRRKRAPGGLPGRQTEASPAVCVLRALRPIRGLRSGFAGRFVSLFGRGRLRSDDGLPCLVRTGSDPSFTRHVTEPCPDRPRLRFGTFSLQNSPLLSHPSFVQRYSVFTPDAFIPLNGASGHQPVLGE